MGKLSTPDWIREGFDSKADWEAAQGKKASGAKSKGSGKLYKVKKCPKCGSTDVHVVLVGKEGQKADNWECGKCGWKGKDVKIEEVNEGEFLKLGEGE